MKKGTVEIFSFAVKILPLQSRFDFFESRVKF